MAEPSNNEMPLLTGSDDDFARVGSLLKSSEFDEETVCRILRIDSLSNLGAIKPQEADLSASESQSLRSLIKLFLLLEAVRCEDVERVIDSASMDSLLALDLLRRGVFEEGDRYYSSVFLYPVAGFLIASDRHRSADGSPFVLPPDAVFPAVFIGTLRFLRIISTSPSQDALDLCSGTGIGAMVLSRCAERVTACDITARATHFAEFNRLLNRCSNVEVLQGDLYSAIADRDFDRIVAHPPYVPSLSMEQIYRDGGETGETLVRNIIEGLPRCLRPGGTFYSVCAGWDTREGAFEERARRWLGDAQKDFDVIFAFNNDMSPERLARQLAQQSSDGRWDERFADAGLERLVYGAMVIDRPEREGDTEPLTARVRLGALTDGECFDWMLRWRRNRAQMEARGELAFAISRAKPQMGEHLQVKVTYAVEEGTLAPAEVVLESIKPFLAATKIDLWMMPVIANFDGERTVAEAYEMARNCSMIPPAFQIADFIRLAADMIERGYLEIR